MKPDCYLKELLRVTTQATTKQDLERMRVALIEAQADIENRLYRTKQEERS